MDLTVKVNGEIKFLHYELADRVTGKGIIPQSTLDRLAELRIALDMPMIINSACRTKERNVEIGGHPRSLHVYDNPHHPTGGCIAFDIRTQDLEYNKKFLEVAFNLGWTVGIANGFFHIDDRHEILGMNKITWKYKNYNGKL